LNIINRVIHQRQTQNPQNITVEQYNYAGESSFLAEQFSSIINKITVTKINEKERKFGAVTP
jgi:hypothetical protein